MSHKDLPKDLKAETLKWLAKIKKEKIVLKDESKQDLLDNINAYIKDTSHFLEKDDLIRAFEAVIYAYGLRDAAISAKIIQIE